MSALRQQMQGSVEGTAAPAGPVTLVQGEASMLGQTADFMQARAVGSILAHPLMMVIKAHGGLVSLELKTANGLDRTVLNEASC